MKHSSRLRPGLVVHAMSSHAPARPRQPQESGFLSGEAAGDWRVSGVFDPHAMAQDYPARWASYIRRFYPDDRAVMWHFDVCERTAQKWRRGEMGCRAHHQSVALLTHGQDAFDMLVRP